MSQSASLWPPPPPLPSRRGVWSVVEWSDFAERARDVRDRIEGLIQSFPRTRGLTTRHLNLFAKTHGQMADAMLAAESVFARQHPGLDDKAVRIIHGPQGMSDWLLFHRGTRSARTAPDLSRAEWSALGKRLKAIRDDLAALSMAFQQTAPRSRSRWFFRAVDAIDSMKCRLDDLACRQHPDWPEATRVFYGKPLAEADDPGIRASGQERPPST